MARGVLLSGDGLADIDILEMRKLVSALETSAQGSSVLDLEVKCGLDPDLPAASGGVGLETEFLPETIEIILGEMVTPFTRSLDAALPGENIVFSMYSTNKNLWVSVHRDQAGREFVSWAATEPLSRRAAALRGHASISTAGAKADTVSVLTAEAGLPAAGGQALEGTGIQPGPVDSGAELPDWRVQF